MITWSLLNGRSKTILQHIIHCESQQDSSWPTAFGSYFINLAIARQQFSQYWRGSCWFNLSTLNNLWSANLQSYDLFLNPWLRVDSYYLFVLLNLNNHFVVKWRNVISLLLSFWKYSFPANQCFIMACITLDGCMTCTIE